MDNFKTYIEKISRSELNNVEYRIDKLFADLGIDVEFTRHFLDRVNDARNVRDITTDELEDLFKKTREKFGLKIQGLKPDYEAVLTDLNTWINLPFVLNIDKRSGEMELVAKTVMRKKNFTSRTKKLFV
jgi:hypothetical protein